MPPPPLTYVFSPLEKTSHEFDRVLRAISVRGRGLARRSREPEVKSIHEARLLIKRLRALLWFARPALDATATARARMQLRKAARLLAGQRDLAVTQSTLRKMIRQAASGRDRAALTHHFRNLLRNRAADEAPEKASRQTLRQALGILCQSADEIKRSAAGRAVWPSPSARLSKAFRATRKAGRKARRTGKDAAFHAWRKKAKRLLYQLELTQAKPGRRMARIIKRVAKLQETLGATQDCVVAGDHLRPMCSLTSATRRVAVLLKIRKARLRKRACHIARRIEALI